MYTDYTQAVADAVREAREMAGLSQANLAKRLGRDIRTVQKREDGMAPINIAELLQIFVMCGVNPGRAILDIVCPEEFHGLSPKDDDDDIRKALHAYVDICTAHQARELLYLVAGEHGSDWPAVLEEMVANTHTSLRSRVAVCQLILNNYEAESALGEVVGGEHVLPDILLLNDAIGAAKKAMRKREAGYSL